MHGRGKVEEVPAANSGVVSGPLCPSNREGDSRPAMRRLLSRYHANHNCEKRMNSAQKGIK